MEKNQQKNFDEWNNQKKKLNERNPDEIFFKEGDVWYFSCGINLGFEQNGKGEDFSRPIVIIKKFNKHLFWGVSLSTTKKQGIYYFSYPFAEGIEGKAILSQLRLYDSCRLAEKIGEIPQSVLKKIKKRLIEFLL